MPPGSEGLFQKTPLTPPASSPIGRRRVFHGGCPTRGPGRFSANEANRGMGKIRGRRRRRNYHRRFREFPRRARRPAGRGLRVQQTRRSWSEFDEQNDAVAGLSLSRARIDDVFGQYIAISADGSEIAGVSCSKPRIGEDGGGERNTLTVPDTHDRVGFSR